ncbi:MAG TPA: DUF4339 domain-containing protein [Sumerlaeia bacterium]|nr:DUF4339 domain-containing protein [Sumerlaeia bacterium]
MKQWFYSEQGEQRGPIPEDQFVQMFQSGQLRADTLVWTEDMAEWTCASEIENLVPAVVPTPPPLPKPPAQPAVAAQIISSGPMFLYIPVGRLVFMSIISSGLYEVYWIYKNWRYLKKRDGLSIHPFWRGIFGIFYCHGILKGIRNDQETNALEQATFSAGGLATGWIILILLGNALGRADDIGVNVLGMIVSFPSFLFFVPVQNYINRVNAKLSPKPAYNPWSAGHIVCLVLGILIWLLVLAGLALPE